MLVKPLFHAKAKNSMYQHQHQHHRVEIDEEDEIHRSWNELEEQIPTPKSSRKRSESPNDVATSDLDSISSTIPKPFFIMDWLEEIEPEHLELARQMLQNGSRSVSSNLNDAGTINKTTLSTMNHENPQTPTTTVTPTKSEVLPRASSVGSLAVSPFKAKSISIGNGWNAKGLAKAKKGQWKAALVCWENALDIRCQILGDTHVDVANTHNNMGIALGKLGRYSDAMKHLECALDIRLDAYGEEHPEIATTLHNIGNVLQQARDWVGAIQCFGDAKRILEQVLGTNHVQVGRACNAIGQVYYDARQYDDALEAFSDALGVFERAGMSKQNDEVKATRKDIQDLTNLLTCL